MKAEKKDNGRKKRGKKMTIKKMKVQENECYLWFQNVITILFSFICQCDLTLPAVNP